MTDDDAMLRASVREYLRDIEERRLPQLREDLAPLERGEIRLYESKAGGSLIEPTQRDIERSRSAIEQYERIVVRLRKGLG